MISHTKKFIIITPPKTGSVSIASALQQYIDITNIIKQVNDCFDYTESTSGEAAKHFSAAQYSDYIHKYKTVGCVRNPFDRMVSWWKWLPGFDKRFTGISFEDFLKHPILNLDVFKPQYDYFTYDNQLVVDNYIKFENIQSDFNLFCDSVLITRMTLPHKNKSQHKHYTEYYNDTTRDIVTSRYARDIEFFGYSIR